MNKLVKVIDTENGKCLVAIGDNTEYFTSVGFSEMDVEQSEKDNEWYLSSMCPHYTPEEKEAIERERINNLKMTKRVLVMMLEQLGIITWAELKLAIEANPQAQMQWDLCVELERGNPLIDTIGNSLGISSEQIDRMFEYANGNVETLEVE